MGQRSNLPASRVVLAYVASTAYELRMAQLSTASRVTENIRRRMYEKHLSQLDLAAAVGLHQTALSRRLLGRIAFTVDELERIADVLDMQLAELVAPAPAP